MKHLLHSSSVVLGLGLLLALRPDTAQAQTGIGTRTPDASAALDISSTSKGLLVPRVSLSSLSDGSTVPSPATSLIVYNTNASLGGGASSFYGAGFYYNAGTPGAPNWVRLVSNTAPIGLQFWGVLGNTGTNPTNNFLGTADAQDLAFRVNNVERMRLYQGGGLGLGNITTGNLLLGFGAAAITPSGGDNSFIGINAGRLISAGFQNTFVGSQAGPNATTGNSNTFIGFQSGRDITNGSSNTFIGTRAGLAATGSGNTYIGDNAAFGNASGSNNTAIGTGAGGALTLGSNNTFIGVNANTNTTGIQGSTAIGAGATVDADNSIVLGTNGVRVGIGISTPLQALHVSGGALITTLGGPIGSAGDRVVVADASGNLSTRPLPGGVNDFVQNLSSASTAQNANFNINGTGLIGSRLGIGNLNPQQQLDVTGNGTFSGNLGLGVATPTQRLDVNGGTNISGNTTIGGTLGVTGLSTLTGGFSATNGLLSGSLGVNGQS
ncbi:MAG TPA: hypothetical protein VK364_12685, partial [Hymenobacter sp.]|nr:hypothetical protein [Hymenobacter sp.]